MKKCVIIVLYSETNTNTVWLMRSGLRRSVPDILSTAITSRPSLGLFPSPSSPSKQVHNSNGCLSPHTSSETVSPSLNPSSVQRRFTGSGEDQCRRRGVQEGGRRLVGHVGPSRHVERFGVQEPGASSCGEGHGGIPQIRESHDHLMWLVKSETWLFLSSDSEFSPGRKQQVSASSAE